MYLSFYFEIHTERNYVFVPNLREIVPYSHHLRSVTQILFSSIHDPLLITHYE